MKIVIPAYGRHELTRRVVLYYDDLGYDAIVVETPSDGGNVSGLAEKLVPNVYNTKSWEILVGRKFNDAIQHASKYDDDIVLVGSDCLLSPQYLKYLSSSDDDYIEVRGCHFYDPTDKQVVFIEDFLCGSGKYMSKRMMDNCGWRPYDDTKAHNVDDGPRQHIPKGSSRYNYISSIYSPACLEIRTSKNMSGLPWIYAQTGATILNAGDTGTIFQQHYGQKIDWWTLR